MEQVDRELQQRVWQRVQGTAPPLDCREPLALMGELGNHYRILADTAGGHREQLRQLSRQLQGNRRALLGLCRICGCTGGEGGSFSDRETIQRRLIKCCHLERRLGEALEGLSGAPEWGRICARLAEDARTRSIRLLEILGAAKP